MITVSTDLKQYLEAEQSFIVYLLNIQSTTPFLFNNSDVKIFDGSNVYLPKGFELQEVNLSIGTTVNYIDIKIDNAGSDMVAWALNEEIRNTQVFIYIAAINENNLQVVDKFILFRGYISKAKIKDEMMTITVADEMIRWKDQTLNNHASLCCWRFKDPETCKYSGAETWCDKTYERCLELGNTSRFRGFRYLPSITEQEIWWGQKEK